MTAECCESLAGTDLRGETIPDSRSGAAERKPRAPNDMLQRVTDRRLAETDRRVLHGHHSPGLLQKMCHICGMRLTVPNRAATEHFNSFHCICIYFPRA